MPDEVTGLNEVLANLDKYLLSVHAALHRAGEEIGFLLENYAKTHPGTTPRAAGWIYPGGGVKRRWRTGGVGWGDVTGATQQSTRGRISAETAEYVEVALSAGMDYDVFMELARQGKWAWLWPAVIANENNIKMILAANLEAIS